MDYWILTDIEQHPGRNGVTMSRLRFQNVDTDVIGEMTIDATYNNYHRSGWAAVIRHPCPWGVYSGIQARTRGRTTTRSGVPVLTADSPANLIYRCEDQQQAQLLARASRNSGSTSSSFHNLFDSE